jgi:hypothetical protein
VIKKQRTGRDSQAGKSKDADALPITQPFKELRRKQRNHAAYETAEEGASCNGRRGILRKRVDVIVLHRVENSDLPNAVEVCRKDRGEPVDTITCLDQPRKREQRGRNEDRADVCEGEPVLGQRSAVVGGGELVVDGVDPRHEKEDGGEEAETGAKIEEADLFGVEAVR